MVAVVEQGLGQPAQVPGYWVAGKTGTAQIPSPKGGYIPNSYLVSFIGFAPANNPVLAVLVMVDQPQGANAFGSTVAGPVFAQLIAQGLHDLGVPPDRPIPAATPSASARSGG
jgi:cell division protein FtsI/penicillin-binding protein 2